MTRTVLSDQRRDDAANLVRCGLFPALLQAPVEEHYHESINHPEYLLDDSDVVLEVFFPASGTHRFRNITSFLILFAPHLDAAKNTMIWHRKCRDRHRIHGLEVRAAFVTDLYAQHMPRHFYPRYAS